MSTAINSNTTGRKRVAIRLVVKYGRRGIWFVDFDAFRKTMLTSRVLAFGTMWNKSCHSRMFAIVTGPSPERFFFLLSYQHFGAR